MSKDTQPGIGEPTLFTVAMQVARIEERMAAREATAVDRHEQLKAAVKESVREALAPVNARIDAIEKKAERLTWLSAGASAVLGGLFWLYQHFGKAVGLAFIITLLGCAQTAELQPAAMVGDAHWCEQERPAHVIISDAVSPDCQVAVAGAVAWWYEQGVTYLTVAVVPDDELTVDYPALRFIQVVNQLPKEGATGDTRVSRVTASCLVAAQVRLDPEHCTPSANTAAHELGHALGLLHVEDDPYNLMWPANLPNGFDLTPAQLERVR